MNAFVRWHIKQYICATCLSQNRKMFRFCDLKMQMKNLTPADFALCASDDMVCWECKAHLLKMSMFRARAATAQAVLRTLVRREDIQSPKSLSSIKETSLQPRTIIPEQQIPMTVVILPHQNAEPKTNRCVLFLKEPPLNHKSIINEEIDIEASLKDKSEIKEEIDIEECFIEESEIKLEIENQDDINMDQDIFASELDISEDLNLKTESDLEESKQTVGQQISGHRIAGSQQKGGHQVAKEIFNQQISRRGEKRTIDSDSNSTDSENEYATPASLPVEVTPSDRLSVGDTYKLKFGSEIKDIFTINTINHQELTELRNKRATSIYFVNCNWKCDSCVLNLMTAKAFEEHVLLHKRKKKYVCDICTLTFRSDDALIQHRGYHYRLYKCCSCEFSSLDAEFMKRHFTLHHEVRNITCRHCHLEFTNNHKYKLHYRSAHAKRVKCEKCEKHFCNKQIMKRHIILTHGGVSLVQCPICHRNFKGKSGLQIHIGRIHNMKMILPNLID